MYGSPAVQCSLAVKLCGLYACIIQNKPCAQKSTGTEQCCLHKHVTVCPVNRTRSPDHVVEQLEIKVLGFVFVQKERLKILRSNTVGYAVMIYLFRFALCGARSSDVDLSCDCRPYNVSADIHLFNK